MNRPYDFDRQLAAWLTDEAPPKAPAGVLDGALDRASAVSQRPAWPLPERWIQMQTTMRLATVSRGALYALVILALAILLAVAVFVVGQQHRLPSPLGLAANGLIADDSHGQITLVAPTGETVKTLSSNSEIAIAPAFSTDGQRVAFWSMPRPAGLPQTAPISAQFDRLTQTGANASIVVVDVDSGARKTVATVPAMGNEHIAWSHAGDAIAFQGKVVNGYDLISIVSVDGKALGSIDFAGTPTWSPDDRSIAVTKFLDGVYVANRDGTNMHKVSQVPGLDMAFNLPDWSPDGTKLAFMAGDQPYYSIYVAAADGSGETKIAETTDGKQVFWPRFSPDGAKLAYERGSSVAADGTTRVNWVVANADGSNPQTLSVDVVGGYLGWSPDGRELFGYDSKDGQDYIVLVDAMSGALHRIPSSGSWTTSWQRLAP